MEPRFYNDVQQILPGCASYMRVEYTPAREHAPLTDERREGLQRFAQGELFVFEPKQLRLSYDRS